MIKISKKHKQMFMDYAKYIIPALIIAIIWFGCSMKREAQADSTERGLFGGALTGAAIGGIAGGGRGAGIGALVGGATGAMVGSSKDRNRRRYDNSDYRENRDLQKENKRLAKENEKLRRKAMRDGKPA